LLEYPASVGKLARIITSRQRFRFLGVPTGSRQCTNTIELIHRHHARIQSPCQFRCLLRGTYGADLSRYPMDPAYLNTYAQTSDVMRQPTIFTTDLMGRQYTLQDVIDAALHLNLFIKFEFLPITVFRLRMFSFPVLNFSFDN